MLSTAGDANVAQHGSWNGKTESEARAGAMCRSRPLRYSSYPIATLGHTKHNLQQNCP
jgi:hypothetical protein